MQEECDGVVGFFPRLLPRPQRVHDLWIENREQQGVSAALVRPSNPLGVLHQNEVEKHVQVQYL